VLCCIDSCFILMQQRTLEKEPTQMAPCKSVNGSSLFGICRDFYNHNSRLSVLDTVMYSHVESSGHLYYINISSIAAMTCCHHVWPWAQSLLCAPVSTWIPWQGCCHVLQWFWLSAELHSETSFLKKNIKALIWSPATFWPAERGFWTTQSTKAPHPVLYPAMRPHMEIFGNFSWKPAVLLRFLCV